MAHKALILGIDRYKSFGSLRGCGNDARNMARLLAETFAFPAEDVKIVLDEAATRAKVRPMLTWLFEDAAPGDRLTLHVSGYGSRTVDLADDPDSAEIRELIGLHDLDFDRPGGEFIDEELRRRSRKLPPGVQLLVTLDCGRSDVGTRPWTLRDEGEAARLIERATVERLAERTVAPRPGAVPLDPSEAAREAAGLILEASPEDFVIARFLEPPGPIAARIREILDRNPPRGNFGPTVMLAPDRNSILMAASSADQPAAEVFLDGAFQGAFTYHLCRTLREAGRALDRSELADRLGRALRAGHFPQTPRIEAQAVSGPIFDEANAGPAPAAPVFNDRVVEWTATDTTARALPQREPSDVYRELLETFNRLLDLVRPIGAGGEILTSTAQATTRRHIVYVHGIGAHKPGFSDEWWRALDAYAPSYRPGRLGSNRHEAYWSDLVNRVQIQSASADSIAEAVEEEARVREFAKRLRDSVESRISPPVAEEASTGDLGVEAYSTSAAPAALPSGSPSSIQGFDDFARYLASGTVRQAVMDRFRRVVLPLLRSGQQIDVISHSWGTVVAYEALRQLDADRSIPDRSVRNFFTVGSALAIAFVKWQLLPLAKDGRKPRVVHRWINLNANGDPIGGWLKGRPYAVDHEFANLPAPGCQRDVLRWTWTDPACAHSSYFQAGNRLVNREIFGEYLEG